MDDATVQQALDQEHLRLLRIGYLVSGGASAVFALFPLIHLTFGLVMLFFGFPVVHKPGEPDVRFFGLLFVVMGAMMSTVFATIATLQLIVARRLRERRSRTFCLVVGAIDCLWFPFGTALGICTFIVLGRPSVAPLFATQANE